MNYSEVIIDPNIEPRIIEVLSRIPDSDARTREFMQSLLSSAKQWGKLTIAQQRSFNKVEHNYSDEGIKQRAAWKQKYLSDLKEDTLIAAKYYYDRARRNHYEKYFQDAAQRILDNPDYIPSESLYQKMVLNRYAQKIIEQSKEQPRYAEGDCVMLRGSSKSGTQKEFFTSNGQRVFKRYPHGHHFVVVANDLPLVNAVKGGRVYKILPFAEANVLEVEERLIKKCRGL